MVMESFVRRRAPRLWLQMQPMITTASFSSIAHTSTRRVPPRCFVHANNINVRELRATSSGNKMRSPSPRRDLSSYSRMLDMGGAPSANSDRSMLRTANASKNSRLQAVAFDFRTLLNTKEEGGEGTTTKMSPERSDKTKTAATTTASVSVDTDRVEQVASLLNVELGSDTPLSNSFAAAEARRSRKKEPSKRANAKSGVEDYDPSAQDIRAKYASKLKGGLAGIELAKSQVEDTLTKGDAAGHLAARKIAIMDGPGKNKGPGGNRWLPSSAATQLLTLLTHRSIRIVLLPTIVDNKKKENGEEGKDEARTMGDFKAQLKDVVIDGILPRIDVDGGNGSDGGNNKTIQDALRRNVLDEFDLSDAAKVLLVSTNDRYLKAARDMGMGVCRIRPKNARRGSFTAHYTVETIAEVKDVVNEINGISFNAVLNR